MSTERWREHTEQVLLEQKYVYRAWHSTLLSRGLL